MNDVIIYLYLLRHVYIPNRGNYVQKTILGIYLKVKVKKKTEMRYSPNAEYPQDLYFIRLLQYAGKNGYILFKSQKLIWEDSPRYYS